MDRLHACLLFNDFTPLVALSGSGWRESSNGRAAQVSQRSVRSCGISGWLWRQHTLLDRVGYCTRLGQGWIRQRREHLLVRHRHARIALLLNLPQQGRVPCRSRAAEQQTSSCRCEPLCSLLVGEGCPIALPLRSQLRRWLGRRGRCPFHAAQASRPVRVAGTGPAILLHACFQRLGCQCLPVGPSAVLHLGSVQERAIGTCFAQVHQRFRSQ